MTFAVQKLGSAAQLSAAAADAHKKLAEVRAYFEDNSQTSLKEVLLSIQHERSGQPVGKFRRAWRSKNRGYVQIKDVEEEPERFSISQRLANLFLALKYFSDAVHHFEEYSGADGEDALEGFLVEIKV